MGRAESSERSWDDAQRSRLRAAAKTSAEETPTGRQKEEAAGAKLHGQELGANSSRQGRASAAASEYQGTQRRDQGEGELGWD